MHLPSAATASSEASIRRCKGTSATSATYKKYINLSASSESEHPDKIVSGVGEARMRYSEELMRHTINCHSVLGHKRRTVHAGNSSPEPGAFGPRAGCSRRGRKSDRYEQRRGGSRRPQEVAARHTPDLDDAGTRECCKDLGVRSGPPADDRVQRLHRCTSDGVHDACCGVQHDAFVSEVVDAQSGTQDGSVQC